MNPIARRFPGRLSSGSASPCSSNESGRILILFLAVLVLVTVATAIWLFRPARYHTASGPETASSAISASTPIPAGSGRATNAPSPAAILAALIQTDASHGPLTSSQSDAWKSNLLQLARQKAAALPAIQEFLLKNQDLVFDQQADQQATGCFSLRRCLIDLLPETGGPEAETTALAVLQVTADPFEIATLSRYLDRAAPGKHDQAAITAAREALKLASTPAWDGRDIAPLLDVLKHFAGKDALPDLQQASATWFIYAPILLADLPDGAGIPALIEWTKNPNAPLMSGNDLYLRMLAELSIDHANALNALLDLAQSNRIPSSAWDGIAAAIAGARLQPALRFFDSQVMPSSGTRSFHISAGNQTYLEILADPMTLKQPAARANALDRLLAATENPFARQALGKVRQTLPHP